LVNNNKCNFHSVLRANALRHLEGRHSIPLLDDRCSDAKQVCILHSSSARRGATYEQFGGARLSYPPKCDGSSNGTPRTRQAGPSAGRRGTFIVPVETQWIILDYSADATSASLREADLTSRSLRKMDATSMSLLCCWTFSTRGVLSRISA